MDRKQWDELTQLEKDKLTAKFGLSRGGINNELNNDAELDKIIIPKPKQDEKPKKESKKKVSKLGTKKISKRSNRGRSIPKSKRK